MRNERLLHIEPETAEDQRSGIGGRGAERVEIHLLADEIVQAVDLRPDEDMQLGREEIEHIVDLVLNVRDLALVLVERVRIDDRKVDAAQIEQRIDVFRRSARDDREHVHVVPVVDNPRHLRGEADRRAFQKSPGKAHRPGVDGFPRIRVCGCLLRFWWWTRPMQAGALEALLR